MAFNLQPTQPWHRHLVGPVELETMLASLDECSQLQDTRKNTPSNDYEQELLDYLAQQFPATISHQPLCRMIHAVWQKGMNDASKICNELKETSGSLHITSKRQMAELCEKEIRSALFMANS